jgi:hypothetical protein
MFLLSLSFHVIVGDEVATGVVDWEFAQQELALNRLKYDKEWEERMKSALDEQVREK